jgi:general secretion pathway protein K
VQAYLRGAEELGAMALIADYDHDKKNNVPRDDLSEMWSANAKHPPPTHEVEDIGWMTGRLYDLQGRFNLNRLAVRPQGGVKPPRFTPAQEQFIRLLQAVGEPDVSEQEAIAITEAVSDWVDTDSNPSQDGAEDEYYSNRTPAYRTANRPMASPSELLAVAHMTPALFRALEPYVTVWPAEAASATLNIHTAPAMVLRSINGDGDLSPLSEAEAESLVQFRGDAEGESNFKDLDAFIHNQVFQGKKTTNIGKLLGVKSSYFLLEAEAEVAGRNMRLYSVLHRGNGRIDAIVRATGSL